MAVQDDILNIFSTIRDAGDRATRRAETGKSILDKLTSRERMLLGTYVDPERYSSLEEAVEFDPLLAGRALDMYQSRIGIAVDEGMDEMTLPSSGLASLTRPPRGTPAPRVPVQTRPLPQSQLTEAEQVGRLVEQPRRRESFYNMLQRYLPKLNQ